MNGYTVIAAWNSAQCAPNTEGRFVTEPFTVASGSWVLVSAVRGSGMRVTIDSVYRNKGTQLHETVSPSRIGQGMWRMEGGNVFYLTIEAGGSWVVKAATIENLGGGNLP